MERKTFALSGRALWLCIITRDLQSRSTYPYDDDKHRHGKQHQQLRTVGFG
jgi:hypothetical protein